MEIRLLPAVDRIDASTWNALAGDDDPFTDHAFLALLEESGSVDARRGIEPLHLVAYEDETPVAALPLYAKTHSYGEYIFDWSWADAAYRAGIEYYPKLVSMAPYTPATGTRMLTGGSGGARYRPALLEGVVAAATEIGASSAHLLFLNDDERDAAAADPRFLPRVTEQFHFHNEGYASFDDFLARFRSSMRKKVRRERRDVRESGLRIETFTGDAIREEHWAAVRRFYRDTCMRKGSEPYLTKRFFSLAPERVGHVAATLNFEKGAHLYGRYWGADDRYEMLHFELCYYRLIERCIDRGMRRFEAGAQGTHKLRRGLMPAEIHSAHFIAHPALRSAIADFLPRETAAVRAQMTRMAEHGPFRRDGGG